MTAQHWTPQNFQLEGVKFLLQNSHGGLLWSPGCGKTSCVLATVAALKMRGMVKRALVIAPRRPAKLVWPKERDKWLEFNGLTIDVLHGPKKDELLERTKADICIITPEGLDWLCRDGRLAKLGADMLIVDESSYFRTHSSLRFKNIRDILHLFKRRVILTATPAPKNYENLWSQAFILDQGGALGRYITHFRRMYFQDVSYSSTYSEWALIPGADRAIQEKLKPLMLREDAVDHMQMPQLIHNVIPVELDRKARAVYDQLEDDYVTYINGKEVSAVNAAVLSGKLRQAANGFLYLNADHDYDILHDEKLEAIKALVDDLQGNPVLILYEFVADRNRLRGLFPHAADLGAGCTDKQADAICDQFNAGNLPVLLAHPASAGHGLNLQGQAQHIVWFGPSWNLELHEQATARVWRQGNPHDRVFVHSIVVNGSIEQDVANTLARRDRSQKALLSALKRQPLDVVAA